MRRLLIVALALAGFTLVGLLAYRRTIRQHY
ncbi:hypothetical protein A8926_4709 [Saccharopolyspora spinosa]|uniref:Uncharacterized protein n=1 Tax=Saccharopolyspora spinosa TaxID=60894 RepID=A0A2N3Y1M5_SACSN|nr:hypothetical protein A8926_4709 [Saccharopolyspora spinosa]